MECGSQTAALHHGDAARPNLFPLTMFEPA